MNKKKLFMILATISLLLPIQLIWAQIPTTLGIGVDTTSNLINRIIFSHWQLYLNNTQDTKFKSKLWSKSASDNYQCPDALNTTYISPSLYGLYPSNEVVAIVKNGDFITLKSLFFWPAHNKEPFKSLCLANVVYEIKDSIPYLISYLDYKTRNWNTTTVGKIKYCYFPEYPFSETNAIEANTFINNLEKYFKIQIDTIRYFIAPNCDGIHELRGFDYVFGMGRSPNICGFYDNCNKIIYSNSKDGENHYHEFSHLIQAKFPKANVILSAGMLAYIGGKSAHLNRSLLYHVKRIDQYITEKNIEEIYSFKDDKFIWIDEETNPLFIIGAILCDLIVEEYNANKLIEILNLDTKTQVKFLSIIDENIGLSENNFNKVVIKRIHEIAKLDTYDPSFIK